MDGTLSQSKRGQVAVPEEHKPSQRQVRELRDQRLLAWMKEDFDAGFGKVVEDYWRELYNWAYKLLESSGLVYLAEDAVLRIFDPSEIIAARKVGYLLH